MSGIFWFSLSGVFFLLGVHPFVTYPISLLLASARSHINRGNVGSYAPSITICTCAYNEVSVIEAKIQNLLALKASYPRLDISIYVDGATDGTSEIVARYGDSITADISVERHGKTHGMNRLVAASNSELIVFTDANVLLANDVLGRLTPYFEDDRVGCVCGNLIYINADDSVTAATGSLYWKLEQFIKRRESLLGSVMGADGSIFAIRRALHHPPPDHIIDDMFVSFQVLCAGNKVIQVDDVKAYEKSVTAAREEFRRKVRIACQAFNVHRLIWADICTYFSPAQMYMYISHKLLRWFSIFFLALSFASLVAGFIAVQLYVVSFLLCGLTGASLYAGVRWEIPVLSAVVDILTSLLGAGLGVMRSLSGERYQTWQPAASIRH